MNSEELRAIIFNSGLKPTPMRMLVALHLLADENRQVTISFSQLAKLLQVSKSRTQTSIDSLEAKGWIYRINNRDRKTYARVANTYEIV